MNPLMGMLGGTGGNGSTMARMAQVIKAISSIKKSGNPEEAMKKLSMSDPRIKQAMNMCRGRNPQQIFEQACKQNGMDPNQITGMLK